MPYLEVGLRRLGGRGDGKISKAEELRSQGGAPRFASLRGGACAGPSGGDEGMTEMEAARQGLITEGIRAVAEEEGMEPEELRRKVAEGRVVIPSNKRRKRSITYKGIGEGLRIKVNANIGTSPDYADLEFELRKLEAALKAGTDSVMDLSTGGDLDRIRREILDRCPVPVGTVPVYQAAVEAAKEHGTITAMDPLQILDVIARHCEDGVDFITVHVGITRKALERLKEQGRVTNIVSRGGAFLAVWMLYHDRENPLYEHFDELLEIAHEHDVTLSLGDALRPGCLADAGDRAQFEELLTLGELVRRAREAGVQVMVEGPGHVPLQDVEMHVRAEKVACEGAPFYVLGPLVTDIAPGYDHIASAIGAALAGWAGADFICYVTASEHLALPTPDEVYEGVIAARIAAHAADIARGRKDAWNWDLAISKARSERDFDRQIELAIDPEKARKIRTERAPTLSDTCSMCGKFCALKLVESSLRKEEAKAGERG